MVTVEADFNHLDPQGRLRLEGLVMHRDTPFTEMVAKHRRIVFVDGEDIVEGELVRDPELGWVGAADWNTQDVWLAYPAGSRAAIDDARVASDDGAGQRGLKEAPDSTCIPA